MLLKKKNSYSYYFVAIVVAANVTVAGIAAETVSILNDVTVLSYSTYYFKSVNWTSCHQQGKGVIHTYFLIGRVDV